MRSSSQLPYQYRHQRARRRERFARRAQQLVTLFRANPDDFRRLARENSDYYSLLSSSSVLREQVRVNFVFICCSGLRRRTLHTSMHMLRFIVLQFVQHDSQALVECTFSVVGDDEQSNSEDSDLKVVRQSGLTELGM